DQHRHQHDRGAGADDAADGAGEKPDDEDEEEAQSHCLRDSVPAETESYQLSRRTGNVTRATPGALRQKACLLLTQGWQQGPVTNLLTSDHSEGIDRANQGKLPLRPDEI